MALEKFDLLEKTGDEKIDDIKNISKGSSLSLEPFFINSYFGTKNISFRYSFISFVKY